MAFPLIVIASSARVAATVGNTALTAYVAAHVIEDVIQVGKAAAKGSKKLYNKWQSRRSQPEVVQQTPVTGPELDLDPDPINA